MMKKGMDAFVGILVVMAAVIATTVLVGRSVGSQIENIRLASALERGKQAMLEIKDAVDSLSVEQGSRIVEIELEKGHVTFSSGDNVIYFSVPSGFEIMPSGYRKEEDGLIITSGSNVEVREGTGIEVENEAIVARFLRVGSESSPVSLSTKDILREVVLKKTGKAVYPRLKVVIGDEDQSSGTGYVYAVSRGYGKNAGRVVAKLSSSRYNYTLIFTIPSGGDYIIVKVRDIRGG